MKKVFLIIGLLSIVLTSYAQEKNQARKLSDNLYVATGLWCNATFFVAEDQVYLFDCGANLEQGESLKAQIKQVTDKKVKTIVYTHFHFDHTFGACVFDHAEDIIAHPNCKKWMEKDNTLKYKVETEVPQKIKSLEEELKKLTANEEKAKKKKELGLAKKELKDLKKTKLILPNKLVKDTLFIKTKKENIKIIAHDQAHTEGDCVIEFENNNAVYLGDLLFSSCYPRLGWDNNGDVNQLKEILRDYAAKDFEHFIPGHCGMASAEDLLSQVDYLTDMEIAVKKEMEKGQPLEKIQSTMPKLEKYKHFGMGFMWGQNIQAFFEWNK